MCYESCSRCTFLKYWIYKQLDSFDILGNCILSCQIWITWRKWFHSFVFYSFPIYIFEAGIYQSLGNYKRINSCKTRWGSPVKGRPSRCYFHHWYCIRIRKRWGIYGHIEPFAWRSSRGRSPRELLNAKGYIWPYIPSQVLIRTLYHFNNH